MKSIRWALLALVLGGCVSQSVIDPKGFAPPKSVVIVDVPRLHAAATVGVNVPWAPGPKWFHFSERADYYFLAGSPQGPQRVDYAQGISDQAMQPILNSPKPVPMGQMVGAAFAGAAIGFLTLWWIGPTSAERVLVLSTLAYMCISTLSLALYLYTAELYPTRVRALGTSTATAWLRLASILGPQIVGYLIAGGGLGEVFLVFGLVVAAASLTVALFATETRARVLEAISP